MGSISPKLEDRLRSVTVPVSLDNVETGLGMSLWLPSLASTFGHLFYYDSLASSDSRVYVVESPFLVAAVLQGS